MAVFVRPLASGSGVTAPPESTLLFVLLLNAVLYILVIEAMAWAWVAGTLPAARI
jgi:hypothetical protein